MTQYQPIDTAAAAQVAAPSDLMDRRRAELNGPDYEIWFALAQDPLWINGGKLAGLFLAGCSVLTFGAAWIALGL